MTELVETRSFSQEDVKIILSLHLEEWRKDVHNFDPVTALQSMIRFMRNTKSGTVETYGGPIYRTPKRLTSSEIISVIEEHLLLWKWLKGHMEFPSSVIDRLQGHLEGKFQYRGFYKHEKYYRRAQIIDRLSEEEQFQLFTLMGRTKTECIQRLFAGNEYIVIDSDFIKDDKKVKDFHKLYEHFK